MFQIRLIAFVALALFSVPAWADCAGHYTGGTEPSSKVALIKLCSFSYAVGYSPTDREALWSAEHLTSANIQSAQRLQGRGHFQEDLRLPYGQRSEPYDYKRSGWSRGHLAPSGDAPNRAAREETFLFSNMVPQAAKLNSGAWNHLEANVRSLAFHQGDIYVVTGPGFRESLGTIGPDHVRVPSSLWKAVYVPQMKTVAVVVCKNTTPYRCNTVGLDSLERVTGIDPFPALSPEEKSRNTKLEKTLVR
ncbi:DNA/RNA non-specific endonuclease [Acetobacter sp.]|uniref:DNA/RNA non-specific endonuclease n=1 Tax=Acetobacter sp. TaxID=440 RepID=UPI0039EB0FDB